MKISIIGAGYVGLVTGACFAHMGKQVCCVEVDLQRLNLLRGGKVPFFEPGLEDLINVGIASSRLRFTDDIDEAIRHGDYLFVAVGTPSSEDGSSDLSAVHRVVTGIAERIPGDRTLILKSTVPVGTAEKMDAHVQDILRERGVFHSCAVVSNPEFLKEGAAVEDFMRPDRIILGVADTRAAEAMKRLYQPFNRNHERILVMNRTSAELTKYAANALLATKISFINEISHLAECVGADIEQIRKGVGSDPRIGYDYLYAGCGFGGSCLPKDLRALRHMVKQFGDESMLLDAVEQINHRQKNLLFHAAQRFFPEGLNNKVFAIWGLSFKPQTDDMREAPSIALIDALLASGAVVAAYDPVAMDNAAHLWKGQERLHFGASAMDVLDDADGLLVVTEWSEFRDPDWIEMEKRMRHAILLDGRNLYDRQEVIRHGFAYRGIGRAGN